MKKITILIFFVTSICACSIAQSKSNTKATTNGKRSNNQRGVKSKTVKLDDLKNPFDTTKKIKPARKVNNYIGETEKN